MSVRTTTSDIDEAIIDAAAGLFARQGFDRTSVQQVADAVGYSKTGLLHRFASKVVLLHAVETLIEDKIHDLIALVGAIGDSDQRVREAMRVVTALALAHPGALEYEMGSLRSAHAEPMAADQACLAASSADRLLAAILGPDPTPEAVVRLMLALQLICTGAVMGQEKEAGRALGPALPLLLAEIAGDVASGRRA